MIYSINNLYTVYISQKPFLTVDMDLCKAEKANTLMEMGKMFFYLLICVAASNGFV